MANAMLETAKLPVWKTVVATYRSVLLAPKKIVKVSTIPFVLISSILVIFILGWGGQTTEAAYKTSGYEFMTYAFAISFYPAMIPMITAWHRIELLDSDAADARAFYSIQRAEWRYLGRLILLCLIFAVICIPYFFVFDIFAAVFGAGGRNEAGQVQASEYFGAFLIVALSLFFYGFILRFALCLPSVAIDVPIGFGLAWKKSRKNTWRLIAAFFGSVGPVIFVYEIVKLAVSESLGDATVADKMIANLAGLPSIIVGLILFAAFLSKAYRHLNQNAPFARPVE